MGRIDHNIEVAWVAYHQAVDEATARMTDWSLATIVAMFLLGFVLLSLRGRRSRVLNTALVVAAIAVTSLTATTKYDNIRADGYVSTHGRNNEARTVQIVCSVIKAQILGGDAVVTNQTERERLQKACGPMPTAKNGIEV